MVISFSDIVSLIQVLLWPVILLLLLFIYREQIRSIVEYIGPRVSRLSFLNIFNIELREVAELKTHWAGMGGPTTIQELAQTPYFDSSQTSILSQLQDTSASDCALIDLGQGQEWLTSRLFILSFLLKHLRNLRCFVFVKSDDGKGRIYLGNSTPEEVQDAIARRFPDYADHLDQILWPQYDTSLYKTRSSIRNLPKDEISLSQIINQFIGKIKLNHQPSPDWVQLPGTSDYENASWIDEYQIKRILGKELNESYAIKDANTTDKELIKRVLLGKGEFVAIVNSSHNYETLVDRFSILEQISKMLGYSQ
jgi:hypothetical protein